MDRPSDRLNRFISGYGAGVDALGRPTYTGPDAMYASPREFAEMRRTHSQLKADAMRDDPQGELIRELLDQMKMGSLPGNVRLPIFPLATGSASYQHNEGR